jgi:hypothetical protein
VDAGYGVRLSQSERPEFLGDGEREEEGEGDKQTVDERVTRGEGVRVIERESDKESEG